MVLSSMAEKDRKISGFNEREKELFTRDKNETIGIKLRQQTITKSKTLLQIFSCLNKGTQFFRVFCPTVE